MPPLFKSTSRYISVILKSMENLSNSFWQISQPFDSTRYNAYEVYIKIRDMRRTSKKVPLHLIGRNWWQHFQDNANNDKQTLFGSAKCMRSNMASTSHRGAEEMLSSVSLLRKPEWIPEQRRREQRREGGIATKCSVPPVLFGKITKQQLHMPHINYV